MIISRKKLEEYKQELIRNTIREENERHYNENDRAEMWRRIHGLERDLDKAQCEINKLNMILEVNGLTRNYNTIGCPTEEVNPIHG
jgi:hypothetical protein